MWKLGRVAVGFGAGLCAIVLTPRATLDKKQVFAGVEGGGTTWRVALAVGSPLNIVDRDEFDTTTPEETLGKVKEWLNKRQFDSLGIASFGPVDLHKTSPTYGFITTTPKPGWKNTDVVGPLTKNLETVPMHFDTDVNAPAMAEFKMNRNPKEMSCAYITVGTGIGVGLVINGQCVHGLMHPEGGHISVHRHPTDTVPNYNSSAPFGGESVESFACSGAIAKRAGVKPKELKHLPDDHEAWEHTSHYLAALCANLVLLVSPERIVLSGGVMNRQVLFPLIRTKVQEMLNGYIDCPEITTTQINEFIVPSKYGNDIGLIGALVLAENAYKEKHSGK